MLERWRFRRQVRALAPEVLVSGPAPEPGRLGFFVVHFNAPDFLDLNLAALAAQHPAAAVTVLDNGSEPAALEAVARAVEMRGGVTLLGGRGDKPRHTVALQALFDVAVRDGVGAAVFLDQDALLLEPVDGLVRRLGPDTLLIGPRDAVSIPRADGPLAAGWMRSAPSRIHPSFLVLDPRRVRAVLGAWPFAFDRRAERTARRGGWEYEPYHALSVRAADRILFLDMRMSDVLPPLTFYELDGHAHACHAWYSSRTAGLSDTDTVDGLPVAWVRARRLAVLERMRALAAGRSEAGLGNGAYPKSSR
jgi:hypothetical protein